MIVAIALAACTALAPGSATPLIWDMKALSRPPQTFEAPGFAEEGVRALFFEGPAFGDRPSTRVFAWMGFPKVPSGQKVPGMVLVHGGGGTAFAHWVRLWNERGYAAMAMDTCGCVPRGTYGNWERHPDGGPPGWGGFDQLDRPLRDQWTYHAVSAAILAHSLLRAQPQVAPGRIGLTGISWGGWLTCIIAGVDPRFRFAAPVYGCGFTDENVWRDVFLRLPPDKARDWMAHWDPSVYLPRVRVPMLWVTGTNDFAYTLATLQKSYRLPKAPRTLAVRIRMPHGHGPAGEAPREIADFADSVLKSGIPLARITSQGRTGDTVWVAYRTQRTLVRAELCFTRDRGSWPDRHWETVPATINNGRATASLPSGTAVYFVNLFDDRDCVVSSEHIELPAASASRKTLTMGCSLRHLCF